MSRTIAIALMLLAIAASPSMSQGGSWLYSSPKTSANLQAIDDAITVTGGIPVFNNGGKVADGASWIYGAGAKLDLNGTGKYFEEHSGTFSMMTSAAPGLYSYYIAPAGSGSLISSYTMKSSLVQTTILEGSYGDLTIRPHTTHRLIITPDHDAAVVASDTIPNPGTSRFYTILVDTEAYAATDSLRTVSGTCEIGQRILFGIYTSSRVTTWVDRVGGSDNLVLNGDFTPNGVGDWLEVECYSASGVWGEVSRSDN